MFLFQMLLYPSIHELQSMIVRPQASSAMTMTMTTIMIMTMFMIMIMIMIMTMVPYHHEAPRAVRGSVGGCSMDM